MKSTRWNIEAVGVLVVVGQNWENADMDNPRGETIGERFYVRAETDLGFRRVWGGYYDTPEEAIAMFVQFAPSVELWEEVTPCYGSEAYGTNWREYEANQIDHEKKMAGVI